MWSRAFRKHKSRQNATYMFNIVDWAQVTKVTLPTNSNVSLTSGISNARLCHYDERMAMLDSKPVIIKALGEHPVSSSCPTLQQEIILIGSVRHENLNPFRGLCLGAQNAILMTYAQRGSLYDLIHQGGTPLSADIKQSLLMDIAQGMSYLHSTEIGIVCLSRVLAF